MTAPVSAIHGRIIPKKPAKLRIRFIQVSAHLFVIVFTSSALQLQVIVSSTGGDVFKNGVGTTVLTAVCYQAGAEVDAAGNGTYTWTKYDKNGAIDTAWGTNGTKTGKTLSVSTSDVDTKATFMVVVNI